jgi:RNA polymerase sigma-70 factor (ECF subfamily)
MGAPRVTPTDAADTSRRQFLTLLESHRGILGKVAFTYCRNADDRRDLEQEVATQLWRAFPRYDPARPFATWAYRIALNVAISFVRDTARRPTAVPLDETAVGVGPPPEPDDRLAVLSRFMAQLDHLNRALLVLYLEDRSYRDIADVLGISETNVATKLHRLKLRLRDEARTEDHTE